MSITEEQFEELLSIVDQYAGKRHSREGTVAESLRAVLIRHEEMMMADGTGGGNAS